MIKNPFCFVIGIICGIILIIGAAMDKNDFVISLAAIVAMVNFIIALV